MNKKILIVALLGGLVVAQVASAQEFDDRWYLTGSAGFNFQDCDCLTNDVLFVILGLGKFVSLNWSIDGELNYQNPNFDANQDLNWSQYGILFDLRRHFIQEGCGWNFYLLFGLGYQRSEEEFDAIPNSVSLGQRKDGNFAAKVGVGLQIIFDKCVVVRAELAYRVDFNDQSVAALCENWFGDVLVLVGVVILLGSALSTVSLPVLVSVVPSCADLDDDGDGVNNCDDKCLNSQLGQTIGLDGCLVLVLIDLKGVNFDFNKLTLRLDVILILSEAIEILKRYLDLKVEVVGYIDSKGTDVYNQKLSERRATTVYDYLIKNGVDVLRLVGPIGYGKSRSIVLNTNPDGFDNLEGRAKNRCIELNVQN